MKNYFKINEDLSIVAKKDYTKWFKCSFVANLVLVIILSLAMTSDPVIETIYETKIVKDTVMVPLDIKPSDSSLTVELFKNGCILPAVAVAQARLETGNYRSLVCRDNKNLFGIKVHKCKYVQGERHNHAYYKTYKDNIKCYIHVQNMYLKKIDGRYAAAGQYVDILKGMKK